MKISILISSYNKEKFIEECIASALNQNYKNLEVIVIDNNSTDDSMDVVQNFNNRTKIITKNIDEYKPGKSINAGVQLCSNDYVLVMSGHTQIINLNFQKIKDQLETYKAIFGKQIPVFRGKKITPSYIWSNFSDKVEANKFSEIENRYFLHNAFCFYKKEGLLESPMPEEYSGKEDRFWAKEIIDKGYSYLYDPNQVAYHFWTKNGATWKGIV